MKNVLPLLIAIIILIIAYFSGFSKYIGLAWYGKATLIGGVIGIIIYFGLDWVGSKNPVMAKWLPILIIVDFLIAVAVTYFYARIFIDSAVFERTAGYVWYIGYHVGVALFVPAAAFALQKILPKPPA